MNWNEAIEICNKITYLIEEEDTFTCTDGWRRKVSDIIPVPTNDKQRNDFIIEYYKFQMKPKEIAELIGALDFEPYIIFKQRKETDIIKKFEPANNHLNL